MSHFREATFLKRSSAGSGARNPRSSSSRIAGSSFRASWVLPSYLRLRPDVVEGELLQVERPLVSVIEPLVEESVDPLRGRQGQVEVEVEVEPLQVAGLETPEDVLVPGEPRERAAPSGRGARSRSEASLKLSMMWNPKVVHSLWALSHQAFS